jgi:cytochrome c biogenesis protein CcmG/thiol:disulfide interchange protein DsbE
MSNPPDALSPNVRSSVDAEVASPGPLDFKPSVIRTRVIPALALVMVVGLLGLLAYSLFGPKAGRPEGRINSSGAIVTESGRSAPNIDAKLLNGDSFKLADYRGKIVVLNFWASWCPPCQEETPLLTTISGQLGADVVLVGVDVWDKASDAQSFLNQYQVNYPVAQDEGSIAVDYGLTGVPETFVIDAEGKIAARLPGPVTKVQQLQDMIAAAR